MSGVKYDVQKFNGEDGFSTWQRRMKDLLIQQGFHKALEDKKPESIKDEDWTDIDEKAASAIRLHLSNDVLNNVIDETSANKI